jgi:glycosyltransferase involved in cell wall biosynthesis
MWKKSQKNAPTVSVVMPIYNSQEHLFETLISVFLQDFADFELLAMVEYGTNDDSVKILNDFQDGRLRIIENSRPLGLSRSLNVGIEQARGEYIARMDADDIAYPERLGRQVQFLSKNRDVGICGTYAQLFGDERWVFAPAIEHEAIRAELLLGCTFVHPTVMFRRESIMRHGLEYDEALSATEDYDLWERAARATRLANLPEILLGYRKHGGAATHRHQQEGRRVYREVMMRQIRRLGFEPSPSEIELHFTLFNSGYDPLKTPLADVEIWFSRLIAQNQHAKVYNPDLLERMLNGRKRWFLDTASRRLLNSDGE